MYSGAMTIIRTVVGETNDFPIMVGLHQGSALSPYVFALVMDGSYDKSEDSRRGN